MGCSHLLVCVLETTYFPSFSPNLNICTMVAQVLFRILNRYFRLGSTYLWQRHLTPCGLETSRFMLYVSSRAWPSLRLLSGRITFLDRKCSHIAGWACCFCFFTHTLTMQVVQTRGTRETFRDLYKLGIDWDIVGYWMVYLPFGVVRLIVLPQVFWSFAGSSLSVCVPYVLYTTFHRLMFFNR